MSFSDLWENNFNYHKVNPYITAGLGGLAAGFDAYKWYKKRKKVPTVIPDNRTQNPPSSTALAPYKNPFSSSISNKFKAATMMSMLALRRRKRNRSGRMIQTAGQYTGPFPYPKKKNKAHKDIYALRGSRGQSERNIDAVSQRDVAYIGFSSLPRGGTDGSGNYWHTSPMVHLAMAILRMAFKKQYNAEIESPEQMIRDLNLFMNLIPAQQLDPQSVRLWYREYPNSVTTTGSSIQPTYTPSGSVLLPMSSRIVDIVLPLANMLAGPDFGAQGPVNDHTRELYGIQFIEYDQGAGADVVKPIIRLDDMYCKVNVKQVIYIQNQTKSDSDNTQINVIDSNPIKGRIYSFNDPNPIIKHYYKSTPLTTNEWKLMADVNGDGIIYPDATIGNTLISPWNQLPTGDCFTNMKRYTNISLAPGEMKKYVLTFKFNGLIAAFIRGQYNYTKSGTGTGQVITGRVFGPKALGTSVLFAFEKRLSTGTGDVEVAVQQHTFTSAVTLGRRKKTMLPLVSGEVAAVADDTTTGT